LSFTEKEYDYAVSRNKPVLAFLHKDIAKIAGGLLEPSDEGKQRLDRFRNKAKKSKLVNFYENADDLKAQVLHSLGYIFSVRPMRGWAPADRTPRAELERINDLQQRIISLEAENQRLRERENDISLRLASGSSTVKWNLNIADMRFGNDSPIQNEFTLEATWDQWLVTLFPGGSSYITISEVLNSIYEFILSKIPEGFVSSHWLERAKAIYFFDIGSFDFGAVELLRNDLHRQLTGLGLIREERETVYRDDPLSRRSTAETRTIWKLTPKGEQQLALTRGYLKQESA
jgi:hypothetical protein